ncbi:MAG: amidohydrolase family protein [Deltaproteobacteria bacterium]|jgi:predicted TIM-barrel fold metal-dependent hydrolase|nr:amidohydrolase family protein [Deltaproteobacteria bacterium]
MGIMHMQGIIDFHAHAFPDEVAASAIPYLEEEGDVTAIHDGRVTSLLNNMDMHGVEKSVICSIATRPSQFDAILSWSKQIRSERIIPFPSFHPDDPDTLEHIGKIRKEGFKGIKMHPYYQQFFLDDKKLYPAYEKISDLGLILIMHTGFDIAFPRIRRCDPRQILDVLTDFPKLKMVTTHLGAWQQWDEVEDLLAGRKIYMDISYTLDQINPQTARRIILKHPGEYILFATDSPWSGPYETYQYLKALKIGSEREELILKKNGQVLLESV